MSQKPSPGLRAVLKQPPLLLALVSFGLLVVLLQVIDIVLDKGFGSFDIPIIHFVYALRRPWLTPWMIRLSALGDRGLIAVSVASLAALLVSKKWREAAYFVGIGGGGLLLSGVLKNLIARPRPTIAPLTIERTFSFPSGHSMNSLIIYALLAFGVWHFTHNRRRTTLAATVAILLVLGIGFSRVYLGVHYPSDVVGAYVAGVWWLTTWWALILRRKVLNQR